MEGTERWDRVREALGRRQRNGVSESAGYVSRAFKAASVDEQWKGDKARQRRVSVTAWPMVLQR
jgi:hypothetical protein